MPTIRIIIGQERFDVTSSEDVLARIDRDKREDLFKKMSLRLRVARRVCEQRETLIAVNGRDGLDGARRD